MPEEKKTASYLLTAALATSLGLNVILAGAGVSEVQASDSPKCESFGFELGAAAATTVSNFLTAQVCPGADARLGLSGDTACSAVDHVKTATLSFRRGRKNAAGESIPDAIWASGQTCHAGSWVAGAPQ